MRFDTDVPTRRDGIADNRMRTLPPRRTMLVASILVAALAHFVNSTYAGRPTAICVPAGTAMALTRTACVGLTYLLGKRMFGESEK